MNLDEFDNQVMGMGEHRSEAGNQHPLNEGCFFCATDEELLSGIQGFDEGKPWEGRTLHMQVPESFCPHWITPSAVGGQSEERKPQ